MNSPCIQIFIVSFCLLLTACAFANSAAEAWENKPIDWNQRFKQLTSSGEHIQEVKDSERAGAVALLSNKSLIPLTEDRVHQLIDQVNIEPQSKSYCWYLARALNRPGGRLFLFRDGDEILISSIGMGSAPEPNKTAAVVLTKCGVLQSYVDFSRVE